MKVPNSVGLMGIMSVIGFLVCVYLVKDHYNEGNSMCDFGSHSLLSCSVVNKSSFSVLFNVPVSLFGACWFISLMIILLKLSFGGKDLSNWTFLLFLWNWVGTVFCFYLILAELILRAICPFCTLLHFIIFALTFISWRIYDDLKVKPNFGSMVASLKLWLVLFAVLHFAPIFTFFVFVPVEASAANMELSALDSFSNCLAERNIVMYGGDGCGFCLEQKKLFGSSFRFIKYHNCELEQNQVECVRKAMKKWPTWYLLASNNDDEIAKVEGVQSLEKLVEFSGCMLT